MTSFVVNMHGPSPKYWEYTQYQRCVSPYLRLFQSIIDLQNEVKAIKASIINKSIVLKLYLGISVIVFISISIIIAIVEYRIYQFLKLKTDVLIASLFICITFTSPLVGVYMFIQNMRTKLIEMVVKNNNILYVSKEKQLNKLKFKYITACYKIIGQWEKYCINYHDYPPDWNDRKDLVKKRDKYQCTECGWPNGIRIRRRNLHIHHVIPISHGGNNDLKNLKTLCHICHRQQEGVGHKGIRYINKSRK